MKKLLSLAVVAAIAVPLFAQEAEKAAETAPMREDRKQESAMWPAFFALCEFPAVPDLVGLRVTVPFSTRQENVTGIDIGLWGRSTYFEGIGLSIIRNDVKDDMSGVQVGLYNSVGRGNGAGVQVGLWNESACLVGAQAGLVNLVGEAKGFQLGLINRAETLYGYQVGHINIIRDAEFQFMPIVNIGF